MPRSTDSMLNARPRFRDLPTGFILHSGFAWTSFAVPVAPSADSASASCFIGSSSSCAASPTLSFASPFAFMAASTASLFWVPASGVAFGSTVGPSSSNRGPPSIGLPCWSVYVGLPELPKAFPSVRGCGTPSISCVSVEDGDLVVSVLNLPLPSWSYSRTVAGRSSSFFSVSELVEVASTSFVSCSNWSSSSNMACPC